MKILHAEFIDSYKESLGIEGAEILIQSALVKQKIPPQHAYSKEDALKICEALKNSGGFIAIVANILASRFILR